MSESTHKLIELNKRFMEQVRLAKHHKSHFGNSLVWWDIWTRVNKNVPLEAHYSLFAHKLK